MQVPVMNDAQQKALEFFQKFPHEKEYTLQIPTGVGKSFLMLDRIRSSKRGIIIFPRLALLSQYYREYILKYLPNRLVVCECTDQTDIKDTNDEDKTCYDNLKKKSQNIFSENEIIILTTYHSFPLVAHKYPTVDVSIFDESHHRSEPKIMEIFKDSTIKTKCGILYNFSATPDFDVNQGKIFKYSFQDAIKNHLIRDFSVHVVICSKKNQKPTNPHHFVHQIDHIAQLSHQKNPKYMAFSAFSEAKKENRSNVNTVVKEWGSFKKYWVKGICGNTKANIRHNIMKQYSDYEEGLAVLVSCRTLGEGIDIRNVNGALFIDPRSSTREIIQIIGRCLRLFRNSSGIPLPWEQQLPAVIILPVFIETDIYEALNNDQDQDNFLRDAVNNVENGTFANVLNVASALREHLPELYELCLFYPQGCPSKALPEINKHLISQGYSIKEVPTDGNCFFSCIAEAEETKTASDWRHEIISNLQKRPFQEFGIDPETVSDLFKDKIWNNDAMDVVPEVAAEHLGRCIRIHYGDGNVHCFGSKEDEPIDLLLSDNHYSLLIPSEFKKVIPQCSSKKPNQLLIPKKKIRFHLDKDTRVLWSLRPDVLKRGLGQLEHKIEKIDNYEGDKKVDEIIERAREREQNGGYRIPTYKRKKIMTTEDVQESKDSQYLNKLKMFLRGNVENGIKCTENMIKNLDDELDGWREKKDFEKEALDTLQGIIKRCKEREQNGGNKMPALLKEKNSVEQKQEFKDSCKLKYWKRVLENKINGYCPQKVVDILDKELPGWRTTLDEKAMELAKEIVQRVKERNGKLPIKFHEPKDNNQKQQQFDALRLAGWKVALEGKGSSRCPEEVIEYLDENLPNWRDKKDLDQQAMDLAKEIVKEANKRKLKGFEFIPKGKTKHGKKLQHWKEALEGGRCPQDVQKYLDENLPGWRMKKDFGKEAMDIAKEIVKEANKRKEKGLEFLPKSKTKHGVKLGAWKRELKEKNLETTWKKDLKNFLDQNLPDWTDTLEDKGMKQAKDIVKRAEERKANHQNFLPIGPRKPQNEFEKQQLLDKQKLSYWQKNNCPDSIKDFLNENLPGWNSSFKNDTTDKSESTTTVLEENFDSDESSSVITTSSSSTKNFNSEDEFELDKTTTDEDAIISKLQRALMKALNNQESNKKGKYLAPNGEMKKYINGILTQHLPLEGNVIVLDHTDFGTTRSLSEKDLSLVNRLLVPQREHEEYQLMRINKRFGPNVRHEDILQTLKRKKKVPIGMVYADLMGSIKEAEPILDQLKNCYIIKGGVIAVTISCRDGEESNYVNEFATKLSKSCYKRWPNLIELTQTNNVLVYGIGVRMATMIFKI